MGRYYFNVRRDETVFEDRTGIVLAGIVEAWEWAVKDALTLLREGSIDRADHHYWIEVCDSEHRAVVAFPIDRVTVQ
ncbi:hypothetical protein LJR016_005134 [Devosia sp. LjRoot16]|uniref:DUF6894 family protein n=1 Tax=Devosia sp. LjRoot16 TaxID=3342271 RepID=UPI003ED151EC